MFPIIAPSWFLILVVGVVVYLSMRRKPAQGAVARPQSIEEIPSVLPADAPRCHANPLRNPRFQRPPVVGVVALTAAGCCMLLCLLLVSTVFLGATSEAAFVSYGGPVVAQEHAVVAVDRNQLAVELMHQEQRRLEQQAHRQAILQQQAHQQAILQQQQAHQEAVLRQQAQQKQPVVEAPVLEPLATPRAEAAVEGPANNKAAPAATQQVAAVPLPPQLQPQPQPKPKVINPTRTSAARSQVIKVEGEYQKTREAAWRSALEQAQVEIAEHLRQRGVGLEVRPSLKLIEDKMLKSQPTEEERDFGGNVGVVRRYVLEVQVTPEVRTLLAQQDREFRAQQRMLLVGKVLALVVVLLTAAALYFRLDEYTKGYYTSSLRWAALGVVTGFIVFLFFGS
jgi:hypothetical protein